MPEYLLNDEALPQREYAKQVAADGIITYSYSTDSFKWKEPTTSIRWTDARITSSPVAHDLEQINWINRIFEFIDSITGIHFQRVENQRGEIHINKVADGEYDGVHGFTNGYIQWTGMHNQMQYGGIVDIRELEKQIAGALGVSHPDGNNNSQRYNWNNTLMAQKSARSFGRTFFYTKDDQEAIKSALGVTTPPQTTKTRATHTQRRKEDLMYGTDGVVDTFKLTAKGMILKVDSGTTYDAIGPIINNYNMPYIGNFNPYEDDKILISRKLFNPSTPIDGNLPNKNKAPKGIRIRFKHSYDNITDDEMYISSENVLFNGAGKLMLNLNGSAGGLGPSNIAGINSQIVAFVDSVGEESIPFQKSWIGLF
jgi:hypothetical protein